MKKLLYKLLIALAVMFFITLTFWEQDSPTNDIDFYPEKPSPINKEWIIGVDSIDESSLVDHGEFLTDKNRVYHKFDFAGGVKILLLEDADRATFTTFGKSMYAKDHTHIYESRNGKINSVDYASFDVVRVQINGEPMTFGRDKNHYYFWGEIVEDTVGFGENMIK